MAGIPQVITEDRASGAQFIEGCLKFNSSKGQYLKRRPTANGNTRLWTWSGWLKQTPGGSEQDMFSAGQESVNDGYYTRFRLQSDSLNLRQWNASLSLDASLISSMKLRDPSAFFHCVMIYDVDNSTNTDKVRWYINGQRVTSFSATVYPGSESWIGNITKTHTIGGHYDGGSSADSFWNGHMSQVYFIDGQALGPENFGYTDPLTGTWRPKKYEGDFKIIPDNQLLYNVNTGDNGFDSGTSSRTYDATGRTFTTYSTPQTANPGGYGANSAHVYKSPDGAAIDWVISTDTTDRYIWTSTDGVNWTNTGVQDTDGSPQTVNTAWLAMAGGSNASNVTVTSSTAGYGSVVGRNSFYLPMDGNSPIGEDKSGIVTPNNGSIWSASLSSSSGFRSSEPKTNAFDGNTSSICSAVGSGTITFASPVKFASNSTIRVFLHGGDHTVTVNGGSNQTISAGSFQKVTYTNSGNATFTMTFHRGGGADTGIRAIEIDNHILVDGQIGNSWTPVNFGGSVELPKATGAIPILNTNDAGTVAKGGVRNDAKTYTVTASGGNYYLDGALKPTLNAYRGGSYTFDYTGATSHPFYLSSLPDGKHNSKAYSVEFDGSGDYLSVPDSDDFAMGTGDFTIEMMINPTSSNHQKLLLAHTNGSAYGPFNLYTDSGQLRLYSSSNGSSWISGLGPLVIGTPSQNKWSHVAVTRQGNTFRVFLDGILTGSATSSSSLMDPTGTLQIAARNGTDYWSGFVSNLRIIKGTALYTSNFTPPSTTLTNVTGTTLLCCQDSNATTGAVLPSGSTISANGNAAASNTSPFLYDINGYYGVNTGTSNTTKITIPHYAADTLYYYCSAHSGMGSSINVTTDIFKADPYAWKNFLALPLLSNDNDISDSINYTSNAKTATNSSVTAASIQSNFYAGSHHWSANSDTLQYAEQGDELVFGTGDFTVEFWFYDDGGHNGGGGGRCYLFDNRIGGSVTGDPPTLAGWVDSSNEINLYAASTIEIQNIDTNNRWIHYAAVRSSGTVTLYIDGVAKARVSDTTNYTNNGIGVGRATDGGYGWAGYIQDFRVYKGVAKYTENFVVGSTAPDVLPDTPSGIVGKTNFAKITDGAVAFDGTGDYLRIANSSDFSFGSGDFCVEGFVYYTETSGNGTIAGLWNSGSNRRSWLLQIESDARRLRGFYSLNGSSTVQVNGTTGIMQQNSWHHVALTRNGNDIRLFLNGIQIGGVTESGSFYDNGDDDIGVGSAQGGSASDPITGFLSNVRIVKGSAVYTSNFTPPTEKLTNITGTSLLCCQSTTSASATSVAPGTFVNNGTNYSSGSQVTGSAGLRYVDSLFDGRLKTSGASAGEGATVDLSSDNYILWTPTTGIPYSSKVEVYCYAANGYEITNYYTFNGGTETEFTGGSSNFNGNNWITVATGSGTINSIKIRITRGSGNQTSVGWYAVRVDGTILLNDQSGKSIAAYGQAAANNFNPFTDDINAIRGQETGYPTMNPLAKNSAITLADGNLRIKSTGNHGDKKIVQSTAQIPNGGKWYVEWHIGGSGCTLGFGINGSVDFTGADTQLGTNTYSWGYEPNGNLFHNGNQGGSYGGSSAGDVIGMTIDTSGSTVTAQWYKNGTLIRNSSGTAAEFTGIELGDYIVMMSQHSPNYDTVVNFGQKPFKFPPPDGFQPLNASNVRPETVIVHPDQYVGVSLWTGNGLQKEIGGIKPSENATVVGGTISDPGNAFNGSGANWANLTATNTSTAAHVDFAVNLTGITRIEAAFDSPSSSGDTRGRYNGANGGNTRTGTGSGYSDIYNGSAITVTSVGYGINQNGATGTNNEILSRFRITDSQGTRFILDGGGEPLNFKPDLVWIKSRSFANNHHLFDSVRGPNKILRSSTADQETTVNVMTSFNNDGFTVAEAGGNNATNDDASTFVGWTWKAGGNKNTFNIDDVGYANASDVNMNVGALNSSAYNQSSVWSNDLAGVTYGGASMPKSRMFNGTTSQNVIANSGTSLTFSPSGFSSISSLRIYGCSYTRNANGIVINGTDYTSSFPQGGNSVATWVTIPETSLTSIVWSTTGSGLENGSLNAIEVDGKLLVDAINDNVTWSNAITALSGSSLTNPPNGFDGDEGSYCDSTAGFTLDLSGHTFGTGAHTIEVKSGGASSFTVNGSTSLSGSGSGAIVWSGTHTGELTSLVSSATGASIYYIKVDGEYLLDPGQNYIPNVPSIVPTGCSVGTKQGFSIIKYQGGGGSKSVPHGLTQPPDFVLVKQLNNAGSENWHVMHSALGATHRGYLNTTAHFSDSDDGFGDVDPTSSAFTVAYNGTNKSGSDYISYLWHDVPGLQKFGTYEGLGGTANGSFVELGFRPAIVWVKNIDTTGQSNTHWCVFDNLRPGYNKSPAQNRLHLDANDQEDPDRVDDGQGIDILSNGFRVRSNNWYETNLSGATYIYCAWAEAPTVNLYGAQANAR